MKQSVIILNEINDLKEKMKKCREENKLDEALEFKNQIDNKRKELAIVEEEEKEVTNKIIANENKPVKTEFTGKDISNSLRSTLKGEVKNDGPAPGITFTNGQATLPVETVPELIVLRDGYAPLKAEVKVIPVTGNSGTIPKKKMNKKPLDKLVKGQSIIRTAQDYEGVPYELDSVGAITSISEGDINDSTVDLTGQAFEDFAENSVLTENVRIVDVAKKNAPVKAGKTYKDIIDALDSLPPSVRAMSKIYCNSSARSYLTNLEDKNGRPLCGVDLQDESQYKLKGYTIKEIDPAALPNSDNFEFLVGSMKSIGMPTKDSVRLGVSHDSQFDADMVDLKIVEQIAVVNLNAEECLINVQIPVATAPVVAK